MIALTRSWQDSLPDALFLAPNAPQRCWMMGGGGYQWWGVSSLTEEALAAATRQAAPAIDAFIDRMLEQCGLTESDLVIVGLSQGMIMALHVGLRRPRQVAAIVGYSGMLTGAAELSRQPISRPPVLLIHGSEDRIVPVTAMYAAKRKLGRLGVSVTTHVCRGLGHGVNSAGIRHGCEFVTKAFGLVACARGSTVPPCAR